jgi:hypothetical protein
VFTDDDRRYLYELLERSLDARSAAILMARLPPVGWSDLATRQDVEALRAELKGEMAELRGEVHSLLPRLVAANIASMIGVAGLVFAVASFAR